MELNLKENSLWQRTFKREIEETDKTAIQDLETKSNRVEIAKIAQTKRNSKMEMEGLIATKINNEGIKTNNYNTHLDPSDQRAASKRTEFWIMLNLQRLLKELPVKKSSI